MWGPPCQRAQRCLPCHLPCLQLRWQLARWCNDWMTSIGRRVRRPVVIGGMVHGMTPSRFARGRVWLFDRALVARFPDVHGLAVHQMSIPFFHQFRLLERVVRWLFFFLCMRDGTDSDVQSVSSSPDWLALSMACSGLSSVNPGKSLPSDLWPTSSKNLAASLS